MASGNTLALFDAVDGAPPVTLGATLTNRPGASTPVELFLVWGFNSGTDSYLDFRGVMPQHYAGGGISCRLWWGAASATTGDTVWLAALRAFEDDADDIDVSHTYDFNTVTDTAPSASGEFTVAAITFTNGADMDNVGAGDFFILRVGRNADDGADTMSGDGQLLAIEIRET